MFYNPPYRLFEFSSVLRNGEEREKWIGQLRWENKGKTTWKPCDSDRVCSDHFVDGCTPIPRIKTWLWKTDTATEKKDIQGPHSTKKAKKHIAAETVQTSSPFRTPTRENQEQHPEFPSEHQYCLLPGHEKCGGCVYKDILIQKYQKKLSIW